MAQEYTVFTADGRSATVQAENATAVRDSFRRQFPDLYDQGVIIRDVSTGADSYVSTGYSTSDPDRIAEIAAQGYTPGEASRQGIYEQTLQERPVATRVVSAARAIPVVGEGIDELTAYLASLEGGEEARANVLSGMRMMQDVMDQRRPVESALTQAGVGIGASLPVAAAAAPTRLAGFTPGQAIIRGATGGAAFGAGEGAVSGFLAGRETAEDRVRSAAERGVFGGVLGGVLGGAVPAISGAAARLSSVPATSRFRSMAEQQGISPEALTVLSREVGAEGGARVATPNIPASLAETSPAFRGALDVALVTGQEGAAEARDVLGRQAGEAAERVRGALDDVLGEPTGRLARISQIMEESAPERQRLYAEAYSRDVPYTDDLRGLVNRVPDDVISRANELMRLEGVPSQQMRLVTDAMGNLDIERLPNMQQLDYITRALQDRSVSESAAPQAQRAYRGLTRQLRDELDQLVPEYAAARSRAAEVIGDREAVQAGYQIFRRQMPVEEIEDILSDFKTQGQRENVRAGLRQYIQEQMDRVLEPLPQVITDADVTSRQAASEALRQIVRSEQQRQKLRLVLGEDTANALIDRLTAQIPAIDAATLGFNSATAGRGARMQDIQDAFGETPFSAMSQGEFARGVGLIPGQLLGYGAETAREIGQRALGEVAPMMATQRAPESLLALRQYLEQAERLRSLPLERTQRAMATTLPVGIAAAPVTGREYQRQFGAR